MRITLPANPLRPQTCWLLLLFALGIATARSPLAIAKPGEEAKQTEVAPAREDLDAQPAETPLEPAEKKFSPPASSGALPWLKKRRNDPLPVIRPPGSVHEILDKYDIGESQLSGFFNGQPLSVSEEEVLVRILFRLPRIGLENIQKWRKPDIELAQLVANPSPHRLEVIPLQGRLIGIEQRDVSPELAGKLEFKHFYLARIDLLTGYEALVAVRRVPDYWIDNEELNEPVSLDGIFIKSAGEVTDPKPQLMFAARRIRWFPDQPIPELNIGRDQLHLAELGFDLSLLDDLKQSNRREIGDLDREPQYQLLDLVGRVPAEKLVSNRGKELDIVELLKEPEQHQGELMSVYGHALRITKVVVDDPDIRARFGIDHYYEISMIVDLEQSIHFVEDEKKENKQKETDGASSAQEATKGEQAKQNEKPPGPVFNNDYPVTVCVRELPDNLPPADAMRDLIQVHGIFMKTWAYRSNKLAEFENKMQVSPLLIAKTAERVVPERVYSWISDALVGFALAAAAVILASVFWWFRTNEQEKKNLLSDLERGKQPSFAGLENAPVKPDFSALEKTAGDAPLPGSSPPRT